MESVARHAPTPVSRRTFLVASGCAVAGLTAARSASEPARGAGRDRWTYCLTDLLAGGGVRGGRTYGASDRHGAYSLDHRVTPADVVRTVYHSMGIRDLEAVDAQNRPYSLLEEGRVLGELF